MILPFTTEAKHLGHFFTNNPSAIKHNMKLKRAMNIQKNCDLIQEFVFCNPKTKQKLNKIYNSSYTVQHFCQDNDGDTTKHSQILDPTPN